MVRCAPCLERPKVMLLLRVVGLTEIVEHGDRLHDTVDGLAAERRVPVLG